MNDNVERQERLRSARQRLEDLLKGRGRFEERDEAESATTTGVALSDETGGPPQSDDVKR